MGAGKSLNGREKNVKNENKSPWGQGFNGPVPTAGVVLASDWCQKIFVFFWPITEQQDYESFRAFLHEMNIHASCSPYFQRAFSRRKITFTAQNVEEIRKKLARNTLDIHLL